MWIIAATCLPVSWILLGWSAFNSVVGDFQFVNIQKYATRGGNITVTCHLNDSGLVTWYKDNSPITATRRIQQTTTPTSNNGAAAIDSALFIQNVQIHDQGLYVCTNLRVFGVSTQLTIVDTARNVSISEPYSNSIQVPVGSNVLFRCTATYETTLEWRRNNVLLENGPKTVITDVFKESNAVEKIMTVLSIGRWDSGLYYCVDAHDSTMIDSVLVTVIAAENYTGVKIIEPAISRVEVNPNTPLHIKCCTRGSARLTWNRGNQPIDKDGRSGFTVDEAVEGGVATSLLSGVANWIGDEQLFTCASAEDPAMNATIRVAVRRQDTANNRFNSVNFDRREIIAILGFTIQLSCFLTADNSSYSSVWRRNSVDLQHTSKYSLTSQRQIFYMSIKDVGRGDLGEYRCLFLDTRTGRALSEIIFDLKGVLCDRPVMEFANITCSNDHGDLLAGESCTRTCWNGYTPVTPVRVKCLYEDGRTYWEKHPPCEVNITRISPLPVPLPTIWSNLEVRMGQSVELHCGRAVHWTIGDRVLHTDRSFTIRNSSMIINNIGPSELTVYSCFVSDSNGGPYGFKNFNVSSLSCQVPQTFSTNGECHDPPFLGETCSFVCVSAPNEVANVIIESTCEERDRTAYWSPQLPRCSEHSTVFAGISGSHAVIPLETLVAVQVVWLLLNF